MKDARFRKLAACIAILGCISTAALIIYTIYLYDNCSIISFLANGR